MQASCVQLFVGERAYNDDNDGGFVYYEDAMARSRYTANSPR
jgi:hypothetical protein